MSHLSGLEPDGPVTGCPMLLECTMPWGRTVLLDWPHGYLPR